MGVSPVVHDLRLAQRRNPVLPDVHEIHHSLPVSLESRSHAKGRTVMLRNLHPRINALRLPSRWIDGSPDLPSSNQRLA